MSNLQRVIEAFVSGKYEQSHVALRERLSPLQTMSKEGYCYCATGLLAEVYRQITGKGQWVERSCRGRYRFLDEKQSRSEISIADTNVPAYFGLTEQNINHLYRLNDVEKRPFFEIADYLRTLVE